MKYDFKCEEHGVFEVEQRITETTKTHPCPECNVECNKHFTTNYNIHCEPAAGYKYKKISR